MRFPNAASTGGGGYSIKTTHLEDGSWQASVELPDVAPIVADREVTAIRGMALKLDTYVRTAKDHNV